MSKPKEEFHWIRKKYCKQCSVLYETTSKYSKKCDSCRKKIGGKKNSKNLGLNHWQEFLIKNNITKKDLARYRKNVKKKPKRL